MEFIYITLTCIDKLLMLGTQEGSIGCCLYILLYRITSVQGNKAAYLYQFVFCDLFLNQ